jgi:hypothetical protein
VTWTTDDTDSCGDGQVGPGETCDPPGSTVACSVQELCAVDCGGCEPDCNHPGNPVVNCGFETGDFSGWLVADAPSAFFPFQVVAAGVTSWSDFFESSPTQGLFAAVTGFDAGQSGAIRLGQDIELGDQARTLTFSYRAGFDLVSFCGSCSLDRRSQVIVEPVGGGASLQSILVFTAMVGESIPDTGSLAGEVDLSAFAGTAIR